MSARVHDEGQPKLETSVGIKDVLCLRDRQIREARNDWNGRIRINGGKQLTELVVIKLLVLFRVIARF